MLEQSIPLLCEETTEPSHLKSNCTLCLPVDVAIYTTPTKENFSIATLKLLKNESKNLQITGKERFEHSHKDLYAMIFTNLTSVLLKYGRQNLDDLLSAEFVDKANDCTWSKAIMDIITVVV